MPPTSWRAAAKIAWRSRHLVLGPWERLEAIRTTFGLGIASLLSTALLGGACLLALLIALLAEPWRTPALWTALATALLSLATLTLGLWLLLTLLPRRIRALLEWASQTPTNLQEGTAELRRIIHDVQHEERERERTRHHR